MKKLLPLILFVSVFASSSFGQQFSAQKIQNLTQNSIRKAYQASVRMWAYDTVKRQQAGPQFSAVVVSSEGDILTAAHVNTPGQTYMVTFPNGKWCIARGLGEIEFKDSPMLPDVAMMKIMTKGTWPHAEMGWSSTLQINEPVVSISYPETMNQAQPLVRFGSITKLLNEYGFLQSTCRMEPGDSGGPLFDYLGRVIGLHSAINGDIDYEVPVDLYRKYWTALNIPTTYTALPTVEDKISADTANILSFAALANLNPNFFKTAKKLAKYTFSVNSTISGKPVRITGTPIKTANGTYLISKSSMVGDDATVKLPNGKEASLKVIYRDRNTDLVMLYPSIKLGAGIKTGSFNRDSLSRNRLGEFLISVQPTLEELEVSVIGSTVLSQPKIAGMGYLGAAVAYQEPVALTVVQPGSPAGEAGLQVGDRLVSINEVAIAKPEDYGQQLMKYWAGDTISFKVLREGTEVKKEIVLASRPERPATHPAELFKGGKSARRDGFETVFAHGADLKPEQCGGPIFDLKGNFQGINIARFSRTTTFTLPASTVLSFIETSLSTTQRP